jgi:putative ABC transport system substrate-binding protein
MPVIGLLDTATAREWKLYADAFHQGLSEVGYVEGRNVAIERRWANEI